MSYINSLLGNSSSSSSSSSSSASTKKTNSLGQDAFLQLLVTQLQYQDPLSPMDDKEFVAELAQFSSLEQLTEINSGIENLASVGATQQLMGAVNFIGKKIEATGSAMGLTGGKATAVTFTLPNDAETCLVNVMNSAGQTVRTVDLGATKAGEVEFTWDGKDYDGNVMEDGQYQVAMTATDADGNILKTTSTMTGTVKGIKQEKGTYYLDIGNDRYAAFTDITNVINETSSSSDTGS
jgi:flagellar basal-body rod modification protein FlgD